MRTDFLILIIVTFILLAAVIADERLNTKQKRKIKNRKNIDSKK